MGLTFKENCADIRNSGVMGVYKGLKKYFCKLHLYDPWVDDIAIKKTYGVFKPKKLNQKYYDGIIIAVAHKKFKEMGFKKIYNLCKNNNVIYDLKNLFYSNKVDLRL